MQYRFLTQEQQDEIVAQAMKQREMEHFHYTHNANVYAQMLSLLPGDDWPEHLQKFKGMSRDEVVDAAGDDAELALTYEYRDRLRHLIKTETVEKVRVETVYEGLAAQFNNDDERMAAAMQRVADKEQPAS